MNTTINKIAATLILEYAPDANLHPVKLVVDFIKADRIQPATVEYVEATASKMEEGKLAELCFAQDDEDWIGAELYEVKFFIDSMANYILLGKEEVL